MPAEFKDYYNTLGIAPTATEDEIKKAFRNLARQYHPDVAKDKRNAEEKFKEINEANEVLSHSVSRTKYDQLCSDRKSGANTNPPRGWAGAPSTGPETEGGSYGFQFEGTGFSDFFEQFFGGRASRFRESASHDPQESTDPDMRAARTFRGQDIQGDILITLDEVLRGAMRSISVRRTNTKTGLPETDACSVRIPAGVQAGQSIRVPGKGGEGLNGGAPGDIFLRVHHAEHPDWRARGADLVGHVELSPWEAVLGATVPVRTLEGTVSVKAPAGTQQGHQLRLRGQGLPVGPGLRGDVYLTVSIQVPTRVSSEEEQLWKQIAAASTFDPRKPQPPND